jgi:hypothetical protein
MQINVRQVVFTFMVLRKHIGNVIRITTEKHAFHRRPRPEREPFQHSLYYNSKISPSVNTEKQKQKIVILINHRLIRK